MDYIEAFKNLRTNNKWGRKSPHKAVLLLTIIDLYEQNVLEENEIRYDETLKSTFLKMWNLVLPNEPLFHPDAYLPFWYLQNDFFWHIVPLRGKEDILSLMLDTNVKPSEAKLIDSVNYVELDEDLYFLMTLPSGRSTLKRVLMETYTTLSEKQIERLAESFDNAIDYSVSALSEYKKILSQNTIDDEKRTELKGVEDKLQKQFLCLHEDVQLTLYIEYYTFLKKRRNERDMFKEVCPSVYDLLDKIVNHPIGQGELAQSFGFIYDNFLSDLKVSLLSEDGSMELVDKIGEAIEILRGNRSKEQEESLPISSVTYTEEDIDAEKVPAIIVDSFDNMEIEHVYLDNRGNVIETKSEIAHAQDTLTGSRKGKAWEENEEELLKQYYQQGKDFITIASLIGRTEIAIKCRLAKLGLIEYSYGQETVSLTQAAQRTKIQIGERIFFIENSSDSASILDKDYKIVFTTDGKLKYLGNKLYRLNQKRECFTLKDMEFDGFVWIKGTKKIVAYPQSELYMKIVNSTSYCEEIEEIVDSTDFPSCALKFKGVWYTNNGDLLDSFTNSTATDFYSKLNNDTVDIQKDPLYPVRRQAVLRAMEFFRVPVSIKDIAKAISRTAWRAPIKENDVQKIVKTLSQIKCLGGKYYMRKY